MQVVAKKKPFFSSLCVRRRTGFLKKRCRLSLSPLLPPPTNSSASLLHFSARRAPAAPPASSCHYAATRPSPTSKWSEKNLHCIQRQKFPPSSPASVTSQQLGESGSALGRRFPSLLQAARCESGAKCLSLCKLSTAAHARPSSVVRRGRAKGSLAPRVSIKTQPRCHMDA